VFSYTQLSTANLCCQGLWLGYGTPLPGHRHSTGCMWARWVTVMDSAGCTGTLLSQAATKTYHLTRILKEKFPMALRVHVHPNHNINLYRWHHWKRRARAATLLLCSVLPTRNMTTVSQASLLPVYASCRKIQKPSVATVCNVHHTGNGNGIHR
jgi:hypothetical protein